MDKHKAKPEGHKVKIKLKPNSKLKPDQIRQGSHQAELKAKDEATSKGEATKPSSKLKLRP